VTTTTRPEEAASLFSGSLRATTGGVVVLVSMTAFEAMAVGPALPTAARELHGLSAYGWAFTALLAANVVGMVLAGTLADTRGPRLPLVLGMAAFFVGLVVAGTATTMLQLVVARGVQGLGSGLLLTSVYVVIGSEYPPRLQPRVFAVTSSAWVVPSLVGPLVAGLLAQHASWRWVFIGLLPSTLLGVVLMVPVLRRMHRPTAAGASRSSAAVPVLLRAAAVAAGISVLEATGQRPSLVLAVPAIAGLGLLVWGLRRLLPAGTVRARPGVPAAVALRGLLAGAFFGAEAVVPLSLTVSHGYGATAAGLPLSAAGLSWAVGSWWQGRQVAREEKARRLRLTRAGFYCVGVAVLLLAVTALPGAPAVIVYPAWALAGLGAGLTMSSSSVLLLRATTEADRGADSAALQLSDTTASSVTTGFAGVLVAAAARGAIGYGTAFLVLDLVMAAVAALGILAVASAGRPAGVRPRVPDRAAP
jgi:MFS family permease